MEIFSHLIKKNNPFSSFTIGCPEAEGENNCQISIIDVFEDFLGIIEALAEKVVGSLQLQNTF